VSPRAIIGANLNVDLCQSQRRGGTRKRALFALAAVLLATRIAHTLLPS